MTDGSHGLHLLVCGYADKNVAVIMGSEWRADKVLDQTAISAVARIVEGRRSCEDSTCVTASAMISSSAFRCSNVFRQMFPSTDKYYRSGGQKCECVDGLIPLRKAVA